MHEIVDVEILVKVSQRPLVLLLPASIRLSEIFFTTSLETIF